MVTSVRIEIKNRKGGIAFGRSKTKKVVAGQRDVSSELIIRSVPQSKMGHGGLNLPGRGEPEPQQVAPADNFPLGEKQSKSNLSIQPTEIGIFRNGSFEDDAKNKKSI